VPPREQFFRVVPPQPDGERVDDRAGHLVLDREGVARRAVELSRPQVITSTGVDELRGDAEAVGRPSDAPLEHRRYIQRVADLSHIHLRPAKGKAGGPGGYFQTFDARQRAEKFLREAVPSDAHRSAA